MSRCGACVQDWRRTLCCLRPGLAAHAVLIVSRVCGACCATLSFASLALRIHGGPLISCSSRSKARACLLVSERPLHLLLWCTWCAFHTLDEVRTQELLIAFSANCSRCVSSERCSDNVLIGLCCSCGPSISRESGLKLTSLDFFTTQSCIKCGSDVDVSVLFSPGRQSLRSSRQLWVEWL